MDHNRLPLVHPMDLSYQDLDFVRIHLFLLLLVEVDKKTCSVHPKARSRPRNFQFQLFSPFRSLSLLRHP